MDLFLPKIAYAVATPQLDKFIGNVDRLIVNPLITLMFAVAVVIFLYGMLEFLLESQSGEKKTSGKSHMLWGIVGITIMLAVWTLLGIVLRTFHIEGIEPEQGTVELQ